MKLLLEPIENIIHLDPCCKCCCESPKEFIKPIEKSEFDFLFSTILFLARTENNRPIKICPHCLNKEHEVLFLFVELISD